MPLGRFRIETGDINCWLILMMIIYWEITDTIKEKTKLMLVGRLV
jgi:hypothetical protein